MRPDVVDLLRRWFLGSMVTGVVALAVGIVLEVLGKESTLVSMWGGVVFVASAMSWLATEVLARRGEHRPGDD